MKIIKKTIYKGFSLLEVVVTLGIVSISVFALASAQVRMLKRAEQNLLEAELSAQINNMFEMIRANRSILTEYNLSCTLSANGCTVSSVTAGEDIENWTKALYKSDATKAVIDCEAATNNCNITLSYQGNGVWGMVAEETDISKIANVLLTPIAP